MTDLVRTRVILALLVLALVLLGLGLRLYRLDGQSYWSDEGASVTLALGPLADIAPKSAADIHPPLYYYLLWGWVRLFGPGEFATRSLSALAGTLLVALTFAIGRRTVGTGAALAGAFLCAISPLLIHYSQEARMYELMALWGALSAWLLLRIADCRLPIADCRLRIADCGLSVSSLRSHVSRFTFYGLGLWLGYILVATLGLYTQYFFFTVLLWQNLYALYHVLRFTFYASRNTQYAIRNTISWLASQAIIAALFLPWALRVKDQLAGWPSFGEPFTLPDLLRRVFVGFTFGPAAPETLTGKAELALWALVALSLLTLIWTLVHEWRHPRSPTLPHSHTPNLAFIALYLFVPIAVVYVLSQGRPMDKPDFLKQILAAAPAYCLFLGLGIAGAGRLVNWALGKLGFGAWGLGFGAWGLGFACLILAGLTFFTGRALNAYYHNPKYARDDYRGLAAFVTASERPGDAIILNAPGQIEIFELYYHGPAPRYPLPRQRPIDENITRSDLEAVAAKYDRVWLVLWAVEESDPGRFIEGWLDAHAFKTLERWYGNVRLVLYQAASEAGGAERPLELRLGEAILLRGYRLPAAVRAGEVAPLTLFWQALGPVDRRYKVFAHVIDDHDYLWGQRDAEPAGNARPTNTWQPGETITDTYGLLVLPGTPPGTYHVAVGMYGLEDGVRLSITGVTGAAPGDRALLGPLTVTRPATPPPTEALLIPHPLPPERDLGDGIRLLGYSLTRWGEGDERTEFAPGEVALLTLFWRATRQPGTDYRVRVQLLDGAGKAVLSREVAPAEGHAPTTSWQAGDAVRDQHRLAFAGVAPGTYRLAVALVAGDGHALGPVEWGPVVVR